MMAIGSGFGLEGESFSGDGEAAVVQHFFEDGVRLQAQVSALRVLPGF